jgi:hypothetical protein
MRSSGGQSFAARHSMTATNPGGAMGRGAVGSGGGSTFMARHSGSFGSMQGGRGAFANQGVGGGFNRGFGGYGGLGYGGLGYGGLGFGGLGFGGLGGLGLLGLGYGLGMGLGGFGGYGGYGGYGGGGYGGYGSGGYGGGYGGNYASYPSDYGYDNNQLTQATTAAEAMRFDQAGEQAFLAGQYRDAAYDWRHALVDDPQNGTLAMMLAQALFAQGSYNEAAAATELGMVLLPQEQWGVVVKNYKELYPNNAVYTEQLRAAEKARNDKPDDPALRVLLGFQFDYLGYPTQAAREVEKAVQLLPKDEFARKLLDSIGGTTTPSTLPAPAASQTAPGRE